MIIVNTIKKHQYNTYARFAYR